MLPTERRLPEVYQLIEQRAYFVLHAPRQTGKTTTMMQLARELTASGRYTAVVLSVETGEPFNADPGQAELTILGNWRRAVLTRLPVDWQPPPWPSSEPGARIRTALSAWSLASERPLVVFLDEIDSLQDETLSAILRQWRDGYNDRPRGFPHALGLVGMRDVRDYKIASGGSPRLRTASPFNIKVRSLTLSNFTAEEVAALYRQHTEATGQPFAAEALPHAFELTGGQPYLVNALAKIAVEELVTDRLRPINVMHVDEAKETLILRRETHLDSLIERLNEDRVRRVIEPMLAGEQIGKLPPDDVQYALDLGLVYRGSQGLEIANGIYREIIPRELTYLEQLRIENEHQPAWYIGKDGRLLTDKLMEAFQQYFRQNSEAWLEQFEYKEAGPQLLLQAFLHRIVNGGGQVHREYGLGRRRVDLLIEWPTPGGRQRIVMELKLLRGTLAKTLEIGVPQTWEYADRCNADEQHLVIFDRTTKKPWSKKVFKQTTRHRGRAIKVWGM
jgi:hypothetical protein